MRRDLASGAAVRPEATGSPAGTRSRPEPGAPSFVIADRPPPGRTTGATTALHEVRELPIHATDPTQATRPLRELTSPTHAASVAEVRRAWRDELVASLGGEASLSTQQLWLVEAVTNTFLQLQYLDVWLMQRSTLFVSERRGTVYPVLLHRQSIARTLAKLLAVLGIARRTKDVDTLESYLARKTEAAGP